MSRPPGEVSKALLEAAAQPGTVRQLCERAQVGFDRGRRTASCMRQRGDLVLAEDVPAPPRAGPGRPPAVVVAADAVDWVQVLDTWEALNRSFWDLPPEGGGSSP